MDRVFASDNQRLTIRRGQLPMLCVRVLQAKRRPVVLFESPIAVQRSVDGVAKVTGAQVLGFEHQAALLRVRSHHFVDALAVFRFQPQDHLVRVAGGENQRRSVDGQHQRIFLRAVILFRIHWMQRRRLRRFHSRQRRDHY